jgi:hypothetical protein
MADWGFWGDVAHTAADWTFSPTEANPGENQWDQGFHQGYDTGYSAGNHGFGHEQFGNDFGGFGVDSGSGDSAG